MELLDLPDCARIGDLPKFNRKLRQIIAAGPDKLQVITDFDMTLSRAHFNGRKCCSTHSVFESSSLMDFAPNMIMECRALSEKYRPIEFDPNLTDDEKLPHMLEWWSSSHQCVVNSRMPKSMLKEVVKNSDIMLRDCARNCLMSLNKQEIPVLILSAGLGDIIKIFLEQQFGQINDNIELVSNMMEFDENDIISGFGEPVIHTFNKSNAIIQSESQHILDKIKGRTNVIMLGDTIADTKMNKGVALEENVIKIGFLNYPNNDKMLKEYLTAYDIVLVDDQSFSVAEQILKLILGK